MREAALASVGAKHGLVFTGVRRDPFLARRRAVDPSFDSELGADFAGQPPGLDRDGIVDDVEVALDRDKVDRLTQSMPRAMRQQAGRTEVARHAH